MKLHALLVGIEAYHKFKLKTSLNHAFQMKQFLECQPRRKDVEIVIHELLDRAATRQAVIRKLTQIAHSAQPGDSFLLYYAGHGSQEDVPQELIKWEKDGICETLLCIDSRNGDYDLADKELGYLLHQISKNNTVHIALIMDCCYSEGNSRDDEAGPRISSVSARLGARPVQDFHGYKGNPGLYTQEADHVAFHACAKDDTTVDGVFSSSLIPALKKYAGASYQQIAHEVKNTMQGNPVLRKYGNASLSAKFLNAVFLD